MSIERQERIDITRAGCKELLAGIKNGDVSSGFVLAHMLLSEGPNYDPELLLDIVEAVLELSRKAGSSEFEVFLAEQWPALKTIHFKRLSKKSVNSAFRYKVAEKSDLSRRT